MIPKASISDQISHPKILTGLCFFSICIGVLVFIGWALDVDALKSIVPGYISMKANTAIGFILLGVSSFLSKSEHPKKWNLIVTGICSLIVFHIGALTLLEYYYHFDFGIDELFFKDPAGLTGRFPPGRLAPITATEFLIIPVAIALRRNSFKQFIQLSQFLILTTLLIAFQAIVGYAMGVTYTFGTAFYTQMALHTAITFVTICCALILARPNEGFLYLFFLKSPSGKSMRQLILAAILMPPLVHVVKRAGQAMGLYDSDFSIVVQLMGDTIFFLYVILRNTGDLHKTEIIKQNAEIELKEREERFRILAESLPQLIWSAKANGQYDFFNHQWMIYTGADPSNFATSDWKKIIHPDDFSKIFEEYRLNQDKNFFEAEYRIKNSTGTYEWFLSRTIFIRDESGLILKQLTTATNINAQKKIQQEKSKIYAEQTAAVAIRKSESRLRAIFANAFDGIIGMDASGRITDWNPQAEKIFGYHSQEVIGLSLIDLIIPENPILSNQDSYHHFNTLSDAKINHLMKVEVIKKNQTRFPAQIVITPIRVDETVLYTAFIADITEREKTETDLRYAREQAENAAKMKSEFLANMSHEIRTPLNGIIGMTDLLLETNLSEQQNKFSKVIQGSSNHLLTIINDILDFSKIEAGKLDLEIINFNLVNLIEGQAELLVARAREKNLSVMTFIDPEIPTSLKGDPGRIGQILLNLIGNAIKFTESGSVIIKAEKHSDGNNKILFSIQDTGLGLSQEAQKKLFQAFTQADGSTARKYGGTGLGLSISKRLVTLMNGSIGVDSQEAVGSRFWFELCLPPTDSKMQKKLAKEVFAEFNALVIDDDFSACEITQHYLKNWGIRSETVTNSKLAIEKLKQNQYSVILLDKKMPDMDGIELAEEIKKMGIASQTPLILVTAFYPHTADDRIQQLGFLAHISKPVKQSELYNALLGIADPDQGKLHLLHSPKIDPLKNINLKSARILVAEDNTVNQMVTLMQLKNLGYSANAVANGIEVLAAIAETNYDLILMDCQMPEMDGFQATRTIRLLEKGKAESIAIVALTANAMKEDEDACLSAGMNDYLSKPIKKEKLEQALLQWLPIKKKVS